MKISTTSSSQIGSSSRVIVCHGRTSQASNRMASPSSFHSARNAVRYSAGPHSMRCAAFQALSWPGRSVTGRALVLVTR
jgi:hypothetical protein